MERDAARMLVFTEDDRAWITELWLAIEPATWYGFERQSYIDSVTNSSVQVLALVTDIYAHSYLERGRRRNRKTVRELYDRMQAAIASREG